MLGEAMTSPDATPDEAHPSDPMLHRSLAKAIGISVAIQESVDLLFNVLLLGSGKAIAWAAKRPTAKREAKERMMNQSSFRVGVVSIDGRGKVREISMLYTVIFLSTWPNSQTQYHYIEKGRPNALADSNRWQATFKDTIFRRAGLEPQRLMAYLLFQKLMLERVVLRRNGRLIWRYRF